MLIATLAQAKYLAKSAKLSSDLISLASGRQVLLLLQVQDPLQQGGRFELA